LGPRYAAGETGLLAAFLGAAGAKLDECRADGDAAVAQLSVLTASAFWLDEWGGLYAVPRSAGESDDAYAQRIIRETIRQRPQPMALEQIVAGAFPVAAFYVRDLWFFALLTDQYATLPGRPLQVTDGQLRPDFFLFGPNSATVTFSAVLSPGSFGIWIAELTSQLLTYTLAQVAALLPLELLTDQTGSSTQVLDGQLTTPDFGGPGDTASHTLNLPRATFPVAIADILALIDQHRAAGTKAVLMGTQLQSV
jgi:hypothetical protein